VTEDSAFSSELGYLPKSGEWPWVSANYHFAGWIPNVSGHLSFSLIGRRTQHPKVYCYNEIVEEPDRRSILVYQKRHVKDYPIDGKAVGLFRKSAQADFIMVGRSEIAEVPFFDSELKYIADTQGALCGQLLVIPSNTERQGKREIKGTIRQLKADLSKRAVPSSDFTDKMLASLVGLRSKGAAIFTANFVIFRTGEVRIWFEPLEFLGLQNEGTDAKPTKLEGQLMETLPCHCYHFLKDMTHRHYHHNPDSDQLVQIVRVKSFDGVNDDISWRRHTLWGLARVSLQYRHKNRIADYKRSLGIIAYAESFQATLAKICRKETVEERHDQSNVALYDFGHIKQSMQSVESVATWISGAKTQFTATMFAVLLSSAAFWTSSLQTAIRLCEQAKAASDISCTRLPQSRGAVSLTWIALHPLLFWAACLLCAVAIWVFVIRKQLDINPVQKIWKIGFRLVQSVGASSAVIGGGLGGWFMSIIAASGAIAVVVAALRYLVALMVQN
jgi:hypothetical protein